MSRIRQTYDLRTLNNLYSFYSPLVTDQEIIKYLRTEIPDQIPADNPRLYLNNLLIHNYPNEIAVKSAFINRYLVSSKSNQIVSFEMPVNKSRADLCRINGTSIAYEIKTDLDQLNRIRQQINDYSKVFEYVYIICSDKRINEVINAVDDHVGIIKYSITRTGSICFSYYRKAQYSPCLSSASQLQTLTKKELIDNFLIDIDSNEKDSFIQLILSKYDSNKINQLYKWVLKSRYQNKWFFLQNHINEIYDLDYQFFFKNNISPSIIYQK